MIPEFTLNINPHAIQIRWLETVPDLLSQHINIRIFGLFAGEHLTPLMLNSIGASVKYELETLVDYGTLQHVNGQWEYR